VSGACRACGRAFVGERGQAYCSPTCFAAARRVGLAAGPWRQPGFAARVAATKRARRAEDAGYRSIAARLEALEPAAFGALPERDRAMVRLYYGPGGRRGLHVRRARRPVRPPP
jgi:hypothetical protein